MSEFLRHEPCEVCGSSDAKAIYDDGNTFCFSCQTLTTADQPHQMSNVQFKGTAQRLTKRRISEETCQHYKVYRDGDVLRFPYYSSDRTLQGFKIKTKLKDFKYEGTTTDTLFGQSLIPCLLYTSPSPRDQRGSRMPSSA